MTSATSFKAERPVTGTAGGQAAAWTPPEAREPASLLWIFLLGAFVTTPPTKVTLPSGYTKTSESPISIRPVGSPSMSRTS